MRLTSVEIHGVRSIVDPIEIEFPKNGLFLIKGENGAGKSSILMAISHLLGYCPIPATALQSWFTDDPFNIIGRFETDQGDEIYVRRGKKTSFYKNGVEVTGAKNVETKLLELFHGLDSDLRKLLTYRPQRKPGMFLSLPDARKKDFLSSVIPELAKYEKATEASEEVLEKLQELETRAGVAMEYAQQALVGSVEPVAPKIPEIKAEIEKLDQLNLKVSELGIELSKLYAMKKEAKLAPDVEKYENQLNAKTDRLNELAQERLSTSLNMADNVKRWSELEYVKSKILHAVNHIKEAEGGKCPTCFRAWDDAQVALASYIAERDALVEKAKNLMELKVKIDEQEGRIKAINQESDKLKEEAAQLRSWIEHSTEIKLSGVNTAIAEVSESLRLTQQEQSKYQQAVSFAKNNYTRSLELYNIEKRSLETKRTALVKATDEYNQVIAKLNVERDCHSLTRGFYNSIFDDILVDISDRTNKILARVDNVSDVVIEFRSSYETAKKTIQRRITPFVTIRGKEAELEYGPSGGMYSSVELAVDLAVSEVVSQRSGFSPGFLVLDEPFTGISLKSKEAALEVLQVWAQDRLVIVVDHEGSFQGLFSNAIEVINNNGTTAVRKAT